jgi:DNA-binding GntR family transcriptional regulator
LKSGFEGMRDLVGGTELSELVARIQGRRKKTDLARTAYEQIKAAIVYAKVYPGDYLSETGLAEALGMSRTPVREALRKLAAEDLVEITGRGAFVKEISVEEIKEIFELRRVLECLAAETAVRNIRDAELDALETEALSLKSRVARGEQVDWQDVAEFDNKVHMLLVENCSNSQLRKIMRVLSQHILRYQLLAAQALGSAEGTIDRHVEILQCVRRRDAGELAGLVRRHIEEAEELTVSKVRVQGAGPGLERPGFEETAG